MLIFGSIFTILVVREKGYFWEEIPSKTLMKAIFSDLTVTFIVSTFGIPGLIPIPADFILLLMHGILHSHLSSMTLLRSIY
jgi:H+-transporting ATPase